MKAIFRITWLGMLLAFLFGCENVQPMGENASSVILAKPYNRPTVLGGSCDFPAGVYAPDFQTDEGIYYLAPTKIIWNALGTHRPKRGGLFVPNIKSKDQRQGSWLDQEEDSSLMGAGISSTTRLWRFDNPVPFEIETNKP